jgi:putative colanic acid biosynthesis acetyltransferase WcaF
MEKQKTNLAAYNNSWYQPGSLVKRALWYVTSAIFFRNSLFPFSSFKVFLLRLFGARVGKKVRVKPCVTIKYPWFLVIGNNSWIGENVWIDNLGMVTIGNNVCLSQGCLLLSGNHDYNKATFDLIVKGIVLEDGVWIGAKSIVAGGVVCRDHSVLGAGSVASKELEPYSVYRGNPAVKVKDRG